MPPIQIGRNVTMDESCWPVKLRAGIVGRRRALHARQTPQPAPRERFQRLSVDTRSLDPNATSPQCQGYGTAFFNETLEMSVLASVLSFSFTPSILRMYHLRCQSHPTLFLRPDATQNLKMIGPMCEFMGWAICRVRQPLPPPRELC
jgi:hypothetical protein